jgi:hypothetical protein
MNQYLEVSQLPHLAVLDQLLSRRDCGESGELYLEMEALLSFLFAPYKQRVRQIIL